MLSLIIERLRQKYRTVSYPKGAAVLPERFRGKPHIAAQNCEICAGRDCNACINVCPTGAISASNQQLKLDMGLCTFCGECAGACSHNAISFTREYRLATTSRAALIITPTNDAPNAVGPLILEPVAGEMRAYFKRSLKIREVSAAGCNACEADCNVLSTIVFDLPRFGIDYVASPRHADAMLVTGPVPQNMLLAMQKCYAVMPPPKVVVAVGACAVSGGLFKDLSGRGKGVSPHLNVDLFIPGCPPHPYTILDGLLRFTGKIKL